MMEVRMDRAALLTGAEPLDTPRRAAEVRGRLLRGEATEYGFDFPGESRRRDTVTLNAGNVYTAIHEGWLEVDGERLSLSKDAVDEIETLWKQVEELNEAVRLGSEMRQNAYAAQQQAEAAGEQAKAMSKAMAIFGRMAKGGVVPGKDEKFLMDFDPTLYKIAKMMQVMAEEHDKYDSLLKDEEDGEPGEPPADDATAYGAEVSVSVEAAPAAEAPAE